MHAECSKRIELVEAACSAHAGTAPPRFLALQLAAAAAVWGVVPPEYHRSLGCGVSRIPHLPVAACMLHVGLLRSQLQSSSKGQGQTAAAGAAAAAAAATECWLDVAHWAAWALCVVLTRCHWAAWALCVVLTRCVRSYPLGLPLSPAVPLALQLCGHLAPPTSGCRLSLAASAALTLSFYGVGECV